MPDNFSFTPQLLDTVKPPGIGQEQMYDHVDEIYQHPAQVIVSFDIQRTDLFSLQVEDNMVGDGFNMDIDRSGDDDEIIRH